MDPILVAAGAAAGALTRYLVSLAVPSPWGTMVVNVIGSFILGLLAPGSLLFGVGFCGALTTYSTFGYETVELLQSGRWRRALLNVSLSLGLGLAAAYAGLLIGR